MAYFLPSHDMTNGSLWPIADSPHKDFLLCVFTAKLSGDRKSQFLLTDEGFYKNGLYRFRILAATRNSREENVMTLKENLLSFSGSLSIATTDAPDDYPEWRYITYEMHMADLKELWSKIRPELTKDAHRIDFVDKKLQEAFAAFDAGEKKKGRDAVWELYNLKIENFR